MGINLNDRDYGRQYDFNVPQEGSGPAGGWEGLRSIFRAVFGLAAGLAEERI